VLLESVLMNTQNLPRVVAVIVAYNRRDLLLEALTAVAGQTVPAARIVVVDNASDDGSGDAARELLPEADVLRLARNTGGAGGFAVGLARAVERHDAEWVWLMDDDTIPTPTALERLLGAVVDGEDEARVDVAGSRVVWTDGRDHPMNTPREKFLVSRRERIDAARVSAMAVRSSSFVSMLVRADAVRERGLPIADYFIWNDDFEYSTRLLRGRRGLFVPSSVVVHKTRQLGAIDVDPGPRFYYEVRNKLWLLLRSPGLAPLERALYAVSTLRRWLRTVVSSADRAVLLRTGARGAAHGLLRGPRSNAAVLADLADAAPEVERLEAGVPPRGGAGVAANGAHG
jgi:GT2 family glycosyltransferase